MTGVRATSAPVFAAALPGASAISAWIELTKPRISFFVGFATLVGALLGAGPGADLWPMLEAALWVFFTSASACVFNQVLEKDVDALMLRTQKRPLVRRTIQPSCAIAFGAALGTAGVAGLAMRFNWLAALLALATVLAYALVYTPLKRLSTMNTLVGAFVGAMPPLLGYTALAGEPGRWGIYLFMVLFIWQFPHFMAIAWLYREDYARAGLRMLPALSGTAGMAGRTALAYGLALLPISILPAARDEAGLVYVSGALGLSLLATIASQTMDDLVADLSAAAEKAGMAAGPIPEAVSHQVFAAGASDAFLFGAVLMLAASLVTWIFLNVKHQELATDGPEGAPVHMG